MLNRISIQSKKHWGYPDEWIENWTDDLLLKEEDLGRQNTFILEADRGIIGFCSVREEREFYEIYHLWILPEFIGKGFGKQLLNETLHEVVRENKKIVVEADPNAEPFYRSQGFVTFDKVESYPKGRFLPVMERAPSA